MNYCNFDLKDEQTLKTSGALPEGFTVKYVGESGAQTENLTYVRFFQPIKICRLTVGHSYSAQQSVTGSPYLSSRLRDLRLGGAEAHMKKLVGILDSYLATPELSPLTRAQYEVQRHWLAGEGANVAEALIMFACLPGMAGVPTPTGGMALWLPIGNMVSRHTFDTC